MKYWDSSLVTYSSAPLLVSETCSWTLSLERVVIVRALDSGGICWQQDNTLGIGIETTE